MQDTRPKLAHSRKIASFAVIAPGAALTFRWENPPWDTVVTYSAYPILRPSTRPGEVAHGVVEIVRTRLCVERDEKGGASHYALIDVRNSGTDVCDLRYTAPCFFGENVEMGELGGGFFCPCSGQSITNPPARRGALSPGHD